MKQKIAIKHRNSIVIDNGTNRTADNLLAVNVMCSEMLNLGFIPTEELLGTIRTQTSDQIVSLMNEIIPALKHIKGADVDYHPMYPNFPDQVAEMSYMELYINAILHYWSCGEWTPNYSKEDRQLDITDFNFTKLGHITEDEFSEIFTELLSSNDSLSEFDRTAIEWFITEYPRPLQYPEVIPFKENMAIVGAHLVSAGGSTTPVAKTATDILRIVTHMNGGDVSLATNTKFKSLPRSIRRVLVYDLERVINIDDIIRHKNKWIKLFHNLHVGDYSDKVFQIAKKIRNGEYVLTFNGAVQAAIDSNDIEEAVVLLVQRPGDFARRLDKLFRLCAIPNYKLAKTPLEYDKDSIKNMLSIAEKFMSVIDKVSTKVLTQLYGHFKTRHKAETMRIAFPKGNTQYAQRLTSLDPLPETVVSTICNGILNELMARYQATSNTEDIKTFWVDPNLDFAPIPSQQRSASEGTLQVARGTHVPFSDEKSTIRFFIYWIGRDIDLSAVFFDDEMNKLTHVSYTNLRHSDYKAYHSGDITNAPAPKGAAEFIDIDIESAVKYGARYVSMNVLVYSGPTFNQHDKVYAGWMLRNSPNSNEIFDPRTVEQKIDVTLNSRNAIPVIFDLIERKAIWTDLATQRHVQYGGNNVESNSATINETLKFIVDAYTTKMTLSVLFKLYALANNWHEVNDKNDADITYGFEDCTITPYDVLKIQSEFLK